MINLIMPMAGRGSRFSDKGFEIPKPLIEINGKPFFYWSVRSVEKYLKLSELVAVVLKEHIDDFQIDQKIKSYFPQCKIVALPEVTEGAVVTCLNGTKLIDNENPIIFNDCDHLFCCSSFYDFCESSEIQNVDGGLLTFNSDEPKFSFAELDSNGNLIKTVEKVPVSNHAICGAYYFKNRTIFENAAQEYLKNCQYSEYFVSGVYNILAKQKKTVKIWDVDIHLPFGTPEEYSQAENSAQFSQLL